MKLDERLANMSVNHKAKISNKLIRKVYTGTQDLSDLDISVLVAEYDKNPNVRMFCGKIFMAYGVGDLRKIYDFIPMYGLSINPMKLESEIDNSIKYYTNKLLNRN